jgi:tripartite-type tricarboxylate transporter receptor subunit TctC
MSTWIKSLCVVAALLGVSGAVDLAQAQNYPARAITLVIPFAPGGTSIVGRAIADKMSELLGEKVVVDNRPGAGGTVGTKAVAEGSRRCSCRWATPTLRSVLALQDSGYDPRKDFAPIGMIGNAPNSLVCIRVPAKSVAELITYARPIPTRSISLGRRRHRQPHHRRIFRRAAGIKLVHIPYKGTGPALTDLLGGHIPMAFAPIPASHANVSAGKLRALAVTSVTRSGLLPDVPTMIEAGLSSFDASLYYGLVAPSGTPRPIIDKLNKALREALASDEVKKQLGNDGTEIKPGTPEDYADFIDKDEKKWSQLVKASGVEQE